MITTNRFIRNLRKSAIEQGLDLFAKDLDIKVSIKAHRNPEGRYDALITVNSKEGAFTKEIKANKYSPGMAKLSAELRFCGSLAHIYRILLSEYRSEREVC